MYSISLVPYRSEFLQPLIQWRQQAATRKYNPLKAMNEADVAAMLEMESAD